MVDTLGFEPGGSYRWYSSELGITDSGTYRRAGDTLLLQARLSENPGEEERAQGPGRYRMVLRDGKLELVYAQYGDGAKPLTTFEPPAVFTPLR